MPSVKKWLLLPFESQSKRERSRYYADKPDDSPPPQAPGQGDAAPARTEANGFKAEIQRSQTHSDFSKLGEEDMIHDYNAPTHMWVVATLFPIIAGTFGPMASMFNICAIASDWRIIIQYDPNTEEAVGPKIQDPSWLIAVNAVSLAVAIVANLSLLGQMTNRIRYNISAPITIAGFYISGIIDIALVAAAPTQVPLPDNPNATWSQAFYYAAMAGAIYAVLAIMLSITGAGIWLGHYSDQFKLSMSQRSLMLQTMVFLGYILAAGGVYGRIEGWEYLNSTYFIVVTLFTIGFGDLVPKTHLGRSLFFPMTVGGILYVGVIVANIRALVLESFSVKVSTRMVEQARLQAVRSGDVQNETIKIRGVMVREMKADTELERRRKEFEIMREIQHTATQNNRLFSLGSSTFAFCILWFVGAAVFWQAEQSTGGQNWSYFESIYFTFVAQLTIGYGDYEPQTNSAKPAFVFWALIALPTLTVLIGAVGDSISDFVNWYTVWIGKHARTFFNFGKAILRGKTEEDPKRVKERIEKEVDDEEKGFTKIANVQRRSTIPLGLDTTELDHKETIIAEDAYRPLMLLRAANKVVEHLDDEPPKKYTFEEWCWLLKLLGEDETSEEGHRRVCQPLPEGAEVVTPLREQPHHVWSWMGQESPLMSLEDDSEPKWVLRRLMRVLEKDLKQRAERRLRRELGQQLKESKGKETNGQDKEDKIQRLNDNRTDTNSSYEHEQTETRGRT